MRCLIVGCGYIGHNLATKLLDRSWEVYATTRSAERAAELEKSGLEAIVFDWLSESPQKSLPKVDCLVIAVSHSSVEGIPVEQTHTRGLNHLFGHNAEALRDSRVVYLSTTGVFSSEQNGDWVDEESVIAPTRSGAIAAAAAEDWFDVSRPSAVVLRPSGIYGPERIPNIDRLKNREPIPVEPDSYLNLVHRDDVTRAIETLLTNYQSNQLYCVTDDQPTLRGEYYSVIAEHLGLPAPVFESAQPSGRGSANKRVSNARLKRDFHFEFEFPSFREGLLPMLTLE